MAHFAKIENDRVVEVIVVNNEGVLNAEGVEEESIGIAFCSNLFPGSWVQTSYSSNIRKQYASIGMSYDSVNQVFILQKPFPSWILDTNFDWQPPTPKPTDSDLYMWEEGSLSWVLPAQALPPSE